MNLFRQFFYAVSSSPLPVPLGKGNADSGNEITSNPS